MYWDKSLHNIQRVNIASDEKSDEEGTTDMK